MRPLMLSIATTVLLATVGPAWGDPGKDESGHGRGKGRGGPPAWAGRGDKDQKEYYKKLEEQQRENRKRFEEQQREGRKRYEERIREEDKRAREAEREYRENLPAQGYRGGYDGYRHSGYRGYTPLVPYPNIAPQPGGYGGYPNQSTNPYVNGQGAALADQLLGSVGAWLRNGQGGYGGNPSPGLGVPYSPGPDAPYRENVPPPPGGYDGYQNQPISPYLTGQYPPGPSAPDSGYPPPEGYGGYPAQPATPYPAPDYPPPGNPNVPQVPPGPPTGGQITALAHQLVGQANTYLQEFAPKIGVVPESQGFLADGTALRDAATRFREVAYSGAPPDILAGEFRNVAASWQRLESRMARVSKGRIGPNIAKNLQMGGTIEQIRRLLP